MAQEQIQIVKPKLQIIKKWSWLPPEMEHIYKTWNPKSRLGNIVRKCIDILPDREMAAELLDAITSCLVLESSLAVALIRADGTIIDGGIVSRKVITTAGVNFLVDAWENVVELETLKYHALGTGSTAEAVGDTALVTEWVAANYTGGVRATGTLVDGSGANILQTVATNTKADAGSSSVQEHGLFSASTPASGTLWDRSLTGTWTLSQNDGLQTTYNMTANSGG